MHVHKRTSFFPLVVALLSLGLIIFMFYAFSFESGTGSEGVREGEREEVTVSVEEYQKEIQEIVATFEQRMFLGEDALERLLATEEALDDMMAMRVPAQHQGVHLKMALTLSMLKDAFRSEDRDDTEILRTWFVVVEEIDWIKK